MNVRFLGTGYGECKVKKKSVKDYRRAPSLLIDDKILIDPSEAIFDFSDAFSLDGLFDRVGDVLITHSHPSHLCAESLLRLAQKHPISVFGPEALLPLIPSSGEIVFHPLCPGEETEIDGYRILPLPANHTTDLPGEICLWYVIERGRSLLYAVDGGIPTANAYRFLKGRHLDVLIADCALADCAPRGACFEHGCLETVALTRDIFLAEGILGERGRTILTHIPTDRKISIHESLTAAAQERGMNVAYDGYFLNV